ncbi:MAG: hypothetical protein JWO82_2038, partial [Akkermansiaceae bacterium]|nr:hypothetical protein [Akkermansiaceae bacterium]
MRLPFFVIPLVVLSQAAAFAGTPQQADAARKEYELGMQQWALKMKIATTQDQRAATMLERPDLTKTGRKLWAIIQPNLMEEWSLEPAAWLVKMSPSMTTTDSSGVHQPA